MSSKKALLLSIRPKYASMIFAGIKTVELRRVRPRLEPGDLVFVYVSSPTKALRGAFEVADILCGTPEIVWETTQTKTGLNKSEFDNYFTGKELAFGIVIGRVWENLSPVKLSCLRQDSGGFAAPQSYHYVCQHEMARKAKLQEALKQFM